MQSESGSEAIVPLLDGTAEKLAGRIGLSRLAYPVFDKAGVEVFCKRDELLHPTASGNKLYKLWGHLQLARQQGARGLCTFGGYYSNHLHALARVGRALGIPTLGFVRGHEPRQWSATLRDCRHWGMELQFLSRLDYRAACDGHGGATPQGYYCVPEGGGGAPGLVGCRALGQWLGIQLQPGDNLCLATGTGTTLRGILQGLEDCGARQDIMAFAALRLGPGLPAYRQQLLQGLSPACAARVTVQDEQSFGGFGRVKPELLEFMVDFEAQTGVGLDPVYTGKMLYAISQLAAQGHWRRGTRLVVLHSGGLQGRRGVPGLDSTAAEGEWA
ncbi:1-aminocyclopropane-1-carboxylate deaminase/D-cysteine desulfhydrase [Pseudomaricurvus sp. HS19]|uniref:1-aminocyclopropane-1-carboxylate deaminase/D-cysteine desulfhydrase n=1 Tax=Pseudomaricurvus sp. HS19 TaxID=2692626 RepID=UPI00136BBFF3|nr:pyridoxal-phosphate dependent enzyme [Pseudomaricurvus sp. HS19]MYM62466.1 pyridoxal-phosphate dependent enzyme [Pseudomaricurvus sp. HS19]